jgi:hypothetical protein
MAKKTRRIPTMVVNVDGNEGGIPSVEGLCSNDVFKEAVYKETVESIKDAIKNKRKIAVVFDLYKSEYYLEINKSEWIQALQSCLDVLVEKEDYLNCVSIKELIDKIN